jgi:nitrite reductase/ring-hydroxylating ferredoxin subunit
MNEPKYKWVQAMDIDGNEKISLAINEVTTIKAGGKKICLGRLEDGYHAVGNTCPHAGGPLGYGWCDGHGNVVCPHHRYKYDLRTGKNSSGEGYYVRPYPVEERPEGIFIGMPVKSWFFFD